MERIVNVGKRVIRYGLDSLLGSFIYFILILITTAVLTALAGPVGIWIVSIVLVVLLTWVYKFHPGAENPIVDLLPILIIAGAITATLNGLGYTVMSAEVKTVLQLGYAIFALYLADTIVMANIKALQE